jgi:hypothetical protein
MSSKQVLALGASKLEVVQEGFVDSNAGPPLSHESLVAFFKTHCPVHLKSVEKLLFEYAGKEEELCRLLLRKYGAAPGRTPRRIVLDPQRAVQLNTGVSTEYALAVMATGNNGWASLALAMAENYSNSVLQVSTCSFIISYLEREEDENIKRQVLDALVDSDIVPTVLMVLVHLQKDVSVVETLTRFIAAACTLSTRAREAVIKEGGVSTISNIARLMEKVGGGPTAQDCCTNALRATSRSGLTDRMADPRIADRQRQDDIMAGLFGV